MIYSSDFENKFVCGEIMSYDDLREYGSEASVKAAGKLRQQGKPYESKSSLRFGLTQNIYNPQQWWMATLPTGRLVHSRSTRVMYQYQLYLSIYHTPVSFSNHLACIFVQKDFQKKYIRL